MGPKRWCWSRSLAEARQAWSWELLLPCSFTSLSLPPVALTLNWIKQLFTFLIRVTCVKCSPWMEALFFLKWVADASFEQEKSSTNSYVTLPVWVFGGCSSGDFLFFFILDLGYAPYRLQGICLHLFYLLIWGAEVLLSRWENACKCSPSGTRCWQEASRFLCPAIPLHSKGCSNVRNALAFCLFLSIKDWAETRRLVSPQTEVEVRSERWKGNILSIKKPKAFGFVPEQQMLNHHIPTGGFMAELQRW